MRTTAGSEDGREVFARECGQEQTFISKKKTERERERERMDSSNGPAEKDHCTANISVRPF